MSWVHTWLRRESRADIAGIWQAYQAAQRLVKEDLRLARRMATHPEWTSWWERADQITEAEVLTPDGIDPYLAIIAEAMVEFGDPEAIGVTDLGRPDYGEPVPIRANEVPVFWGCGVTPQAVAVKARVDLMITHEPAQMFVTDLPREGGRRS